MTTERREYELTDEQLEELLDACEPVPYIVVGGAGPRSSQDRANSAWCALGHRLGFDGMTVEPIPSKGDKFFTAIPTPTGDGK